MTESGKRKLLLVEDEAIIALAQKAALEKYGYAVTTVHNGERAVEAAEGDPELELVLMDINLGRGIDGTQAADRILEKRDIPILFLSSHTEPEIVEKTEKISSYGYVVKSSNMTVLDASIKMAFKLHSAHLKEQELTRQLQFQAAILDQIGDHVAAADLDGRITYANDVQCRVLGLTKEEIIGQKTAIFSSDPSFSETQKEIVEQALREGFWRGEIVNVDKDGRHRLMDCRIWTITGSGEFPHSFAGVATDITELKTIENENRVLADVIRRSSDFIGVADIKSRAFFVNPAGRAMVGLEEEDVSGTRIEDYFFEEDRPFVENTILPTVMKEGRWAGEFRFRHFRTGEAIDVLYDLFLTEDPVTGQATNITTITRNITERKTMERQLAKSEALYRSLMENSIDAVYLLSQEGKVLNVNGVACEMTGYTREELLGLTIDDIDPNYPSRLFIDFWNSKPEGATILFDTLHRHKNGTTIPVEVNGIFFRNEGERLLFGVARARRKEGGQ